MGTVNKEKYKTLKDVFDMFTEKNLFKLISQGYIDGLEGPLSMGKEANVFLARSSEELRVVKIYRLQTCDFNKMYDYIKADPRYTNLKRDRREVIFSWAQREFRNLLIAREKGMRVPTPYVAKDNILIMECVGGENVAQKLVKHKPQNIESFFKETIKQITLLYKANLIHADLSGFNILNDNEKPVLIDMSQATPLNNPNAEEYLKRDVHNICKLFDKWGLEIDEKKIIEQIKKQKV